MERITKEQLYSAMREFNRNHPDLEENPKLSGVVVYSQDNWSTPYSLESRSYRIYNCNRAFQDGKISCSVFADSLDDSDIGVRLDWVNWKVDYCYLEN